MAVLPKVAVCVVGYRNPEDIVRCIAAIAGSTYDRYEVVICENGGEEAHAALAVCLPKVLPGGQPIEIMLAPANLGYAGGVNRCIEARPDADVWWVVNPDAEPSPDAMALLVARLLEGDADAVGCTLYWPDGRVQAHGGRWRPWLARAESIGHGSPIAVIPDASTVEREMSYLLGASMMVDRRFVEVAGPMREDYFLYGEEIEWFLRARSRGLKLGFAPGARVLHSQGATTGSAAAIKARPRLPIYLDERNKLLVTRDTASAPIPVVAATTFVLAALRFARRGAWRQWRFAVAGWWAGIRNLRGLPPWMSEQTQPVSSAQASRP